MARRKEHTHEQIKHMAIEAVVMHLQHDNLHSLSLRKVASQIGYVPSTLINIFGSYQYLLLAVSEQTLVNLSAVLQGLTLQAPITNIQNMAMAYSDFALQHKSCFRLVFELTMPDDQPLPQNHTTIVKSLFALVESQLRSYCTNISEPQAELMSRVLWGGIHGLTTLALDEKLFATHNDLHTMLCSHVQGYIAGISKTGSLHDIN
ncbi:TetR family transcriptional regulator [Shewanella algicola]|uniref:WHG domain-containing protein n=1 Tax=Shewanella algicola TaxID=640633 RepID=A0A9X1Z755_9GAMM|nr:TetR-like C-terminal domain-containing protein [Shewanella algicola]MCL1105149.1 WHG domain-containing protein [Shewanella algicola]GGP49775.1 TetR family transcriptional regulator [Shewanella algicola]